MTAPTTGPRGPARRQRRQRVGESQAPITTVVVLVAAAIAVIAGFAILRSVTDWRDEAADVTSVGATATVAPTAPPATTEPAPTTTVAPTTTTTTLPPASKSDAVVVVANASGVGGSATEMTAELAADGYTTAPVANSTGPRLERSLIYYVESDPASRGVARLLAEQIPTAQTRPMPDPPPLDRPLAGATVALLLGTDAAGRSLAELAGG